MYDAIANDYANAYVNHYSKLEDLFVVRLIAKHMQRDDGINVLDLACGDALGASLVNEAGLRIAHYTGVDLSANMLKYADDRLRRLRVSRSLIHSNMQDFGTATHNGLDLILSINGGLSYVDVDFQHQWVNHMLKSLNPGGVMILGSYGNLSLWRILNSRQSGLRGCYRSRAIKNAPFEVVNFLSKQQVSALPGVIDIQHASSLAKLCERAWAWRLDRFLARLGLGHAILTVHKRMD